MFICMSDQYLRINDKYVDEPNVEITTCTELEFTKIFRSCSYQMRDVFETVYCHLVYFHLV